MVEQTGSIFMECEAGWLHSNPLCNVVSRDKRTLEDSELEELVPKSYHVYQQVIQVTQS